MNQKIATRGRNLGRAGTARRPLPATVSLPLKRDDGGRCLPYQYLKGVFATVSNQLPMNPRPETVPTLPLPLGEDGPKGRVRERPPGSRTQFVAEARPGGLSLSLFARTRFFAHLALLLLLLLPLGAIHAQSVSITPGTSTPMPTTDYSEDHDDLSVKVMGGQIVIRRAYMDKQWYANRAWAPLKLTFASIDGSVKEISGLSNVYKKTADG